MKHKCLICGGVTKTKAAIFCSISCYYTHKRKRPIVKCASCGIMFGLKPSRIKKGRVNTCSNKCRGVWQSKYRVKEKSPSWKGGLLKFNCKYCGKEYTKERGIANILSRFCSHSCSSIYTMIKNAHKRTSIEIKVAQELSRRKIDFIEQKPFRDANTIVDFFIPPSTIIYADGDYWHSLPKQVIKDADQNLKLIKLGFTVYRFWGSEINKCVSGCIDKVVLH